MMISCVWLGAKIMRWSRIHRWLCLGRLFLQLHKHWTSQKEDKKRQDTTARLVQYVVWKSPVWRTSTTTSEGVAISQSCPCVMAFILLWAWHSRSRTRGSGLAYREIKGKRVSRILHALPKLLSPILERLGIWTNTYPYETEMNHAQHRLIPSH